TATADAGEKYQTETLFIGDSNTVRLYANGLISLQQFCAKEGIGTHVALNEGIVTFKRDDNRYTIAQAVAKMKPRRVVIMLGTNDTGMEVADFIANYSALVQAIQTSYPYTDIIVNTVPPVPAEHSNYPNMDQTKIDDFNMALLSMCEQMGLKFLNTAEALKDGNGYGNADYYQSGDIHLKPAGLKILLSYLRTHAYDTEDRRPDTANIPTRAEYTANPSSAVAAPSSSEVTSSSASSEEAAVLYKAGYRVDKNGGGTLSTDSVSGKTSLSYEITNPAQSVTVTAVPESGYVFVKWSDGVTKKTRTDTGFKQNLDVTAVFAAASVKISGSGKAVVGGSYTFKAKISGKNLDASAIRWYSNGTEVTAAAGETTVTVPITAEMQGGTFKIHATVSYNDSTVTSNTLELTIAGAASSSSSSSGSSSSSHSSSSTGSSSSGSSAGSTSSSGASSSETSSSNGTASFSHSTGSSSHSSSSEAGSSSHSSSAEAGSSSHSSSSGPTTGSSSASQSSSAENDASDSNLADKPAAEEGAGRTNTETALS
ncbi:MAG: SGNH/GDSL hydrolase family protein, partial [Faecalibacterium prausnitzii]|nr:SGNH/GDSL hydrolase family protein [Faecalibacterium prausnitzii]